MQESGVDAQLLPLCKLSLPQIKEAYFLIATLAKNLEAEKKFANCRGKARVAADLAVKKLASQRKNLTDKFYILIPHKAAAGRRMSTSRLPDITLAEVPQKLDMLNSLLDIHEAHTLLTPDASLKRSTLDVVYERLCTTMETVPRHTNDFAMIEKLMQNGCVDQQSYEIEYILKVRRAQDAVRFEPHACRRLEDGSSEFGARPRNLLLWHGTRGFNMIGILSKGLRIAPPEAPVSGYMFGKGIYFADMFQKSAGYCDESQIIMLCEVAVGNSMCLDGAKYVEALPEGYDSTQGVGSSVPSEAGMFVRPDGCGVNLGTTRQNTKSKTLRWVRTRAHAHMRSLGCAALPTHGLIFFWPRIETSFAL